MTITTFHLSTNMFTEFPINPSLHTLFRFSALAVPVLQIHIFSRVPPSLWLGELLFLLFYVPRALAKTGG
jgi:hypothetical protein